MSRTISDAEMERRKIVAKASSAITDTMDRVTQATGALSAVEWVSVLLRAADRVNSMQLLDEWTEVPA